MSQLDFAIAVALEAASRFIRHVDEHNDDGEGGGWTYCHDCSHAANRLRFALFDVERRREGGNTAVSVPLPDKESEA